MPVVEPEQADSDRLDPESLEEIFKALEEPLLRYALRLVRQNETAQDIFQEAFLKLHKHIESVRQPRPWLYRTVHNLAMNHLRAAKKLISLHTSDSETAENRDMELVDNEVLPDEHIERMEAIGQTRLCLQSLDERKRELVRLKFEEGLSYQQMSEQLGISTGNVGYLLHHTLKQLATELENTGVNR